MVRFLDKTEVSAQFGAHDFGEVVALDVGEYDDPTQLGAQYYTFSHERRQSVVRFRARGAPVDLLGSLHELVLSHQGAVYRGLSVCTLQSQAGDETAYVFETQENPRITESARERHGVNCLATALLLDALQEAT